MIARESMSELAESLRRLRSGEDASGEIVRWLRVCAPMILNVPAPQSTLAQRRYTRTLLYKTPLFEVLALHWSAGCTSSIHDHGGARCWLSVVDGTLGVENFLRTDGGLQEGYAQIALEGREELSGGAIDFRQDDLHLHRCIAREKAVTLHVYAHPIERFNAFNERENSCYEVTSSYDAVLV